MLKLRCRGDCAGLSDVGGQTVPLRDMPKMLADGLAKLQAGSPKVCGGQVSERECGCVTSDSWRCAARRGLNVTACNCRTCHGDVHYVALPAPAPESPSVQVTEADRVPVREWFKASAVLEMGSYRLIPKSTIGIVEDLATLLAARYAAGLADGLEKAAQEAETYRGSYVTDIEPHAVIPSHPASAAAVGLQKGAIWIAAAIRALISPASEEGK